MTTTRQELRQWFDEGKANGRAFMVIWTDTFDYTDYPVYYDTAQLVREDLKAKRSREMTRAMEVYDLSLDRDEQVAREHCWELPKVVAAAVAYEQAKFDKNRADAPDLMVLATAKIPTITSTKIISIEALLAQLHELGTKWDDEGADLIYNQQQEAAGKAVLGCARQLWAVLDGHS